MSAEFWVGPPGAPDTYRLVSLIGGGGEGEVWKGVLPLSTGGRRQVAVKVMRGRPEPAWDRVGHLMTSLSHPGLVRVTDVFSGSRMHRPGEGAGGDDHRYVVMDHVAGSTLRDWCDENPHATAAERLRMLRTVAAALDEMHSGASTEVAVAHGDVKPANIVVTPEGATVLVDLGLVQLTDAAGPAGHSTPYAAPELRTPGTHPTPEADRFAFAVTTAQVLTGQPPPLGRDGWLDVTALGHALAAHPVTARRPVLVGRILAVLQAPPEARPRPLGAWLDAAAETLSQVTNGGTPQPGEPRSAAVTYVPDPPTTAFAAVAPVAPAPPPRRRRGRLLLVAGLAVVALGAGTLFAINSGAGPGPTGNAAGIEPAAAPLGAPATTTPVPSRPTTPASSRSRTSGANGLDPNETAYLSLLDIVDEDAAAGNSYTERGDFAAGGDVYGRSLQLKVSCGGRDGGDYWIEYDLSQDYTRLTAAVGLADTSAADSAVTYEITGDQRPLASGQLTLGRVDGVDVDVTGVLRLRLLINDP
ncbi:MAG: protein kinase, partial [Pseudonocardia sp.]|nr:protein kinase [Pseudonocardia sp.]